MIWSSVDWQCRKMAFTNRQSGRTPARGLEAQAGCVAASEQVSCMLTLLHGTAWLST